MGENKEDITFDTGCPKYGSFEVKFANKEVAVVNDTEILKTSKRVLFPTYTEERISRIRVEKIPSEIEMN